MGLEELLRFFRRTGGIVLVTTVLAAVVAGFAAASRPKAVDVSIAIAINRVNREATSNYQYDGYYALQAADLYAQTVVSWFSTPSVVRDIYRRAELPSDLGDLGAYASKFRTKKYSAQNIVVRFSERDTAAATKLATAVIDTIRERTVTLNETAERKSLFEIVALDPVIAERKPPIATAAVVGGLTGLLLGVLLGSLRRAARAVADADRG